MAETGAFYGSTKQQLPGTPHPQYVAVQVPVAYKGARIVTKDFVDDAHAKGLAVHVWTVNDRDWMEWLIDIGVDGIITDRPPLLERVLTAEGIRY